MTDIAVASKARRRVVRGTGHGHGLHDRRVTFATGPFGQRVHVRGDLNFVGEAARRKSVGMQKPVHRLGGVFVDQAVRRMAVIATGNRDQIAPPLWDSEE